MSDNPPRGPRAFAVDPAAKVEAPAVSRAPRAFDDLASLAIEPDEALEEEALASLDATRIGKRRRKGLPFGKIFMAALGVVVSLAVGLALDELVRGLFARAEWLGWAALAASILLLFGVFGIVAREAHALLKLRSVEEERRLAASAFDSNSEPDARQAVARLRALLSDHPALEAARRRTDALEDEVIDGRDRLILAERELLLPLDVRARALVAGSAKRVSVVTAVSPRAFMDLLFVLFETVRLIRRMSELYGARPGTIGLVKLTRDVLAHLAVTGSIAIGDGIVQQVVGHGLAARLSAKLGEGVVNGLLTARVGIAAMDLCRPMPFLVVKRPSVGQFMSNLTRLGENDSAPDECA